MGRHIQTQSEWEIEKADKVLSFVKNELYLELRFLKNALCGLRYAPKEGLLSLATDGEFLYYPAQKVLTLFQKNPAFLDRAYLHSIMHCIFSHLWIRGNRKKEYWNLACDIAVEYTIDMMDKPCTRRILGWTRKELYDRMRREDIGVSAAGIYRMLLQIKEEELIVLQREFYTDDHSFWMGDEKPSPMSISVQNKWNKLARQTKLEQEQKGEEPKKGEELLRQQMQVERRRRSYKEFLKKFSVWHEEMGCDMDEFDMTYYTYGLSHYGNMPLIEPLESREVQKIKEFVVVLDTSYSTNGELIKNFLRETYHILTEQNSFFRTCHIRILQCDDKVEKDQVVTSQEELQRLCDEFEVMGGGNTDFRPAFTYVNDLIEKGVLKNPGGLLYFTDGKGTYPEKKPPYQTAFLFLDEYDKEKVPVWAMRLLLEPEEFEIEENE